MLRFMQDLADAARHAYDGMIFVSYENIERTRAAQREMIRAQLIDRYPDVQISICVTGLRLRVRGDADARRSDSFHCQFAVLPAQHFLVEYRTTLSVMDLSCVG